MAILRVVCVGMAAAFSWTSAEAGPDCSIVTDMVQGVAGDAPRDTALIAADGLRPVLCDTALNLSGAVVSYCGWSFELRDPISREVFAGVAQAFSACMQTAGGAGSDRPVNHPDSFEQQFYALGDANVSISLKDKGSLGQSLVFMRVER